MSSGGTSIWILGGQVEGKPNFMEARWSSKLGLRGLPPSKKHQFWPICLRVKRSKVQGHKASVLKFTTITWERIIGYWCNLGEVSVMYQWTDHILGFKGQRSRGPILDIFTTITWERLIEYWCNLGEVCIMGHRWDFRVERSKVTMPRTFKVWNWTGVRRHTPSAARSRIALVYIIFYKNGFLLICCKYQNMF